MGNSLGDLTRKKRSAKIMKINGETFKLKTPVRAGWVLEKHPDHLLLDSQQVKQLGVGLGGANPLEAQEELNPNRVYFLVEKIDLEMSIPRRVRSGIQMGAKERLDSLMLARRCASDVPLRRRRSMEGGGMRVKMRVPKAEVERVMAESRDVAEVAHKIVGLCINNNNSTNIHIQHNHHYNYHTTTNTHHHHHPHPHPHGPHPHLLQQKRVGFLPFTQGEIQLALTS